MCARRALGQARVCVVGVGGVGSWVVEAFARSGVGALTLVDLDEVCVTNVNRQLPALDGGFGKFKVEELAKRVKLISPGCKVEAKTEFFNETTYAGILSDGFEFVVDAIDNVRNKVLLIAECGISNFANGNFAALVSLKVLHCCIVFCDVNL